MQGTREKIKKKDTRVLILFNNNATMLTFAECEEGGNGRRFSPGKARFQCGLGSSLTRP